ncbi:MAG: TetR/AcrR family transcriptional regulator [Cyanobium sp. ELA507]
MPRAIAIPAAERRAHAVRTLLDLASHTAPDAISTAAIAERMGLSHGALFRHFPNREAIWAEAVTWATGELERRFDACQEIPAAATTPDPGAARLPPSGPLQQVAALMASHAGLLQQHPGLVRMLFAELQRPATSPARETGKAFMQRFRLRLAALIATAQADGDLEPDLDPHDLAALLVATQQGLMLQALVHDGFADLTERSRRSVALFLRAGPGRTPGPGAAPAAAPGE